jgi:hypothetical protein
MEGRDILIAGQPIKKVFDYPRKSPRVPIPGQFILIGGATRSRVPA